MKKIFRSVNSALFGAIALVALSSQALAGDQTAGMAMIKSTALSMANGYCSKTFEEVKVAGSVDTQPRGTNAQLHRCEYAREMASFYSSIKEPTRFVQYEEWSKTASDIDPSQPRDKFLAALQARQNKLTEAGSSQAE
ncbi:hypothetical protein RYA05_03000 [Pseudomonas syringae pv. actinidiae]|nr:hypothetical protein [Pseudomonas syringae pv. actinidiae]